MLPEHYVQLRASPAHIPIRRLHGTWPQLYKSTLLTSDSFCLSLCGSCWIGPTWNANRPDYAKTSSQLPFDDGRVCGVRSCVPSGKLFCSNCTSANSEAGGE